MSLQKTLIRDHQTEKEFQAAVLEYLRLKGYLVYHTYRSDRSEPGFPDLVCVKPGRPVAFVELKVKSGRLSVPQRRWMDRLEQAGAETHVFYPSDWDVIKKVFR